MVEAYAGTNTPIAAAFLDIARELKAEIATPIAAEASPSGPVQRAAYEEMAGAIVDGVDDTTDAVMLDLHGAMVAEHHDDGEGELLAAIRAKRPGIPICVALDMHCNLTQRMVENCDAMIGYKQPHPRGHVRGRRARRADPRRQALSRAGSIPSWRGRSRRCSPRRCAWERRTSR